MATNISYFFQLSPTCHPSWSRCCPFLPRNRHSIHPPSPRSCSYNFLRPSRPASRILATIHDSIPPPFLPGRQHPNGKYNLMVDTPLLPRILRANDDRDYRVSRACIPAIINLMRVAPFRNTLLPSAEYNIRCSSRVSERVLLPSTHTSPFHRRIPYSIVAGYFLKIVLSMPTPISCVYL